MNFDEKALGLFAFVFVIGSLVGGAVVYQDVDDRLNSLSKQVENSNEVRIVHVNSSEPRYLSELYNKVDQSVVSIRGYGDEDAQGSGFIYSRNGYIVTNEHVIDDANRVEVTFPRGDTVRADVVGMDVYTDLAVLKVNRNNLKPLELGNISEVEVGHRSVAIGNPFGLPSTMTAGIISQKGRTLPVRGGFSIPNVLQTDAAINPGNSGGPLINAEGRVIGVNTAIETNTGTFSGVGFAIPVSAVKRVVPSIIEEGSVSHPWIGVEGIDVDSDIAEEMDLDEARGFLIVDVVEGSPADKAGLQAGDRNVSIKGRDVNVGGDVIVGINDEDMTGINSILRYLSSDTNVGETIEVTVVRNGQRQQIPLTLEARSSR